MVCESSCRSQIQKVMYQLLYDSISPFYWSSVTKKSPTLNVCGFRTFSCAHILPDVKVADELFAKKGQSYSLMSLPRLKTRKRHSFLTSSPLCKCVLVLLRIGLLNGWDTTVRTTFFKPQRQSGFINHCNLYTAYTYMLATHFPRIQQENCWPHLQVESKLFQWCIVLERAVCCRADVYYVSACSVCVYSLLSFTLPSSRTSDKRLTLFCLCADV